MPQADALLNIHQVADYLQLNLSTVYQWAQQGRLPALKLGGRWRFRRADIEDWLDAQARQPMALGAPVNQVTHPAATRAVHDAR